MTTENLSGARSDSALQQQRAFQEDGVVTGDGGLLHLRVSPMGGPICADVLLTHGLGEHSGRYAHVAEAFAERGIRVISYDLRGHGRSSGRRGDVAEYDRLLDDLRAVQQRAAGSGRPLFLLGHSLGGQITLRYLQRDQPSVAGAIIASPWLRLAFDPPRWKLAMARIALRYMPGLRFSTGMRVERLTRDFAHVQAMADPHLMSHRISARMYFSVAAAGVQAMREAGEIRAPLLFLHGDADPVTHWRATEEFCAAVASADKTLKIYPGVLHEAHNDIGRDAVLREVADWIESRLP